MLSYSDLTFVLEKHSFYGLMVKVLRDNKAVSVASSGVPAEVRVLLRKSLAHKDISEELIELLEDHHQEMNLFLKSKGKLIPCNWDSQYHCDVSLNFVLEGQDVVMTQDSGFKGILLLSDVFCFVQESQTLARFQLESKHFSSVKERVQGLKSFADTKSLSSKDITLSVDTFNQLHYTVPSLSELTNFCFVLKRQVVEPSVLTGDLLCRSQYSAESPFVKISCDYRGQDSEYSPLTTYRDMLMSVDFVSDWTVSRRDALLTWLRYFFCSKNLSKERLLTFFLRKIDPQEREYEQLQSFFSSLDLGMTSYGVRVVDGRWQIAEFCTEKERVLAIIFSLLFPDTVEFGRDSFYVVVKKEFFHRALKLLESFLAILSLPLEYSDQVVTIKEYNLTVDLSDIRTDMDLPQVFLNDTAIDWQDMHDLKDSIWASVQKQAVEVLDPALVRQLEQVLTIASFQKKQVASKESTVQKKSRAFHLLDWIVLRQSGVSVKLTDEEEAIIQSFLSFKKIEALELPGRMKGNTRHYQEQGYFWMAFLYSHQLGGILADDMGLGKTYQSILFLSAIKEGIIDSRRPGLPHLIVVPPTLIFNWYHEFEKFYPELSVYMYVGPQRSLDTSCDVMITSYDLLRRDLEKFQEIEFDVLIFDEAQFIKNADSARSKAATAVTRHFTLCLTGTPLENHIREYATILDCCLPGFMSVPSTKIETLDSQSLRFIVQRSKPFILRRLKSQIDDELPQKTEEDIYLDMTDEQKKVYGSLVQATKQQFAEKKGDKGAKLLILTLLMRLRQVCVSPSLVDDSFTELTPKFSYVLEKIKTLHEEGHSVLVFSQFVKGLDILENLFKKEELSYFRLDGSVSLAKRKKMIKSFQEDDTPQAFLISLKAGGFGLNLTKASYVFHIDPWWNPAVENQATDRVHRIGQTQHVFSYKLIMHNSIEEKIQEIKERKTELFQALFEDSDIVKRSQLLSQSDIDYLLE